MTLRGRRGTEASASNVIREEDQSSKLDLAAEEKAGIETTEVV